MGRPSGRRRLRRSSPLGAYGVEQSEPTLYPPVGIAHVTRDTADLVRHRVAGVNAIEVMTASQPNGPPHLGTVTMFMTAFCIGRHLSATFGLPATIVFDVLDNGPAKQIERDGLVWQRSLADTVIDDLTVAELHLREFQPLLDWLSSRSGIPYRLRHYEEFQRLPSFRRTLREILVRHEEFTPLLSPSEGVLRVRLPCPTCRWCEKTSSSTRWALDANGDMTITGLCFEHGETAIVLGDLNDDFVDTNTPVRSVAKAAALIDREFVDRVLTVSVDGSDWSGTWWSRIIGESLGRLGFGAETFPSQYFAPLILDWSGAKFSKSLYVGGNAYDYLPPGLRDFKAFESAYGEQGLTTLFEEVGSWARDPARLFRSYSIAYLGKLLDDPVA